MLFDLPPILALIPLLLYLVFLIRGMDLVFATFLVVVLAAIITGQNLTTFSVSMVKGLGSFLTMIGFIVIMGAGLGRVLSKTQVAQTFVNFILIKIGIKTQRSASLAIMVAAGGLTSVMGTSNGVLAILAPIIIPICAKLGYTRNTVGVLMHGAAAIGLFIGPFTPPTITTITLANISYGTYLLHVALPISALIWASTYFMVQHVQKKTANIPGNLYTADEYDTKEVFVPTKEGNRNTLVFFAVIFLMVIYGIINKSGAPFALTVEIAAGIAVAISARMSAKDYVTHMVEGASVMMRLFICFILCAVMLDLIMATGAFNDLAEFIIPYANSAGNFGFAAIATLIGIFGISGAAVAQEQIMATVFGPTVELLKFPAHIWAAILLVGSQVTSFVMPGGDIYAPMSLARSDDVKSMLKNGYSIAGLTIAYILLRTLFI